MRLKVLRVEKAMQLSTVSQVSAFKKNEEKAFEDLQY